MSDEGLLTNDNDDDFGVVEDEKVDEREAMLDAMLTQLNWLRDNPQLPIPYSWGGGCFLEEDEARRSREGVHGWTKVDASAYIQYYKAWGPKGRVSYSIYVDKSTTSTCKQVRVGTRVVPAVEAHEEPVMKWVCEPIKD